MFWGARFRVYWLPININEVLFSTPMLRFFRALLQPAPTSRFDPYRWRRDDRTTGRKVLDGIRLAVGLVTGFVVLMMALAGVATQPAVGTRYSQHWILLSWTMLCLATVTLFLTANRWAPVGPAFFVSLVLLRPSASL